MGIPLTDHCAAMPTPPSNDSAIPPKDAPRDAWTPIAVAAVLTAMFFVSRANYLLFHSLAELFSIAVAWGVFMLVWNARRFVGSDALVVLGTAYLFVGLIDLLHTLAYKGMGVFAGAAEANLATQAWIAGRYLESVSILAFAWLTGRSVRQAVAFPVCLLATAALLAAIFVWPVFPDCFVTGTGLTAFKKISEYIVCLILAASLIILYSKRAAIDIGVFAPMAGAIVLTMAGELAFTFYVSVYGFSNLVGHFAKIGSFFLVYLALIRSGLTRPYAVLFENWKQNLARLTASEEKFSRAFYSSPMLMTISRVEDGTYLDVNDTFVRTTGYTLQESIGRTSTQLGFIDAASRNRLKETLIKQGQVQNLELELVKKDGTPMVCRYWGELINAAGEERLLSIALDVTGSKQVERLLAARLHLSKYADGHSVEAVLRETLDAAEQLTGSQIGFLHFVDADQRTINLQMWSTSTMATRCTVGEFERHYPVEKAGVWVDCVRERRPMIHNDYASLPHRKGLPDGHAPIVRQLVTPMFRDDKIVAILGVGNKPADYDQRDMDVVSQLANMAWDIVVRKNTEQELVDSRRDLQTLVGNLPGMAFRCLNDADWTMQYISDGCRELTGYDPAEFIGNQALAFNDVIHPDDRQRIWDNVQAAIAGGRDYQIEYRIVDRHGGQKWVWERGRHVAEQDAPGVIEGFVSDISDRKAAEQRLQLQALVLDQIQDRVTVTDLSGTITYVNDAEARALGYSEDELLGRPTEVFGEDPAGEGATQAEILERTLADGSWQGEVVNFTRDGRRQIMNCRTVAVKDDMNQMIALCGIATDITERRQRKEELNRLASAIEQAAESIMITDAGGKILFVNPAFEKITGYRREEVQDKTPRILKSGQHDAPFYAELWRTITAGQTWTGQFTNRRKDGSLVIEKGRISPVFDQSGRIINFVAVKNDVTDEMRMEENLRQAQKMEAIGTLAGGIAHDFNNILFPMLGFTEMIKEDLPADSHLQDYAADILAAAIRARDLVQQILAFSRQTHQERHAIRVQQILKEAVKLTRASLPSTIAVKQEIDENCLPVLADPTQVHQIAMNLITNAYHAMEARGGTLTITLQMTDIPAAGQLPGALQPGPHVRLGISDTGTGIDRSIRDRIFEPYFTTKGEGKGTGLGLSVIHGIVTACGGDIRVQSELGRGTTFSVYLPCIDLTVERQGGDETETIQGGDEHILLVDDEMPIVTMVGRMLKRLGYRVTARSSGVEALEMFRSAPRRFDLVLSDMTMPNLTGDRLLRAVKTIREDIPVILCTGFSDLIDKKRAAAMGAAGFVLKPVLQQDLDRVIRRALDGREDRSDA